MSITSASLIGFAPSLLTQHRRHQRRSIIVANSSDVSKSTATSSPLVSSTTAWKIDSWRTKKALQLPEYPDQNQLHEVLQTLTSFPPIVFAGEARNLEDKLAQASMGNAFLLMGGDCAESFKEFSANNIRDTFRVILQMGVVLMFGAQMPVIKVSSLSFLSLFHDHMIKDTILLFVILGIVIF
jgi:3-deoxy-7-phosphoheptulonate synthase